MDADTFLRRLREEPGAVQAELIPAELWDRIVAEEATVKACGGRMEIEDLAVGEVSERMVRICLFEDGNFRFPECSTMRMVDSMGHMVGRHLTPSEIPEYMCRDDVVFLSDDFILFPDADITGDTRMVMTARPYQGTGDWVPEEARAVMWFPSTTTDMILHEWFGRRPEGFATAIMGIDL